MKDSYIRIRLSTADRLLFQAYASFSEESLTQFIIDRCLPAPDGYKPAVITESDSPLLFPDEDEADGQYPWSAVSGR